MKILEKKIRINNWGLILLGLKKTWITKKSFYHLLANEFILCSEDLIVEFYLIEEESLESLLNLLEKIIVEENEKTIIYNEFDYNQKDIVPEEYYEFWGVEFLLRLLSEDLTKDEVLDKVVLMHSDFIYYLGIILYVSHL